MPPASVACNCKCRRSQISHAIFGAKLDDFMANSRACISSVSIIATVDLADDGRMSGIDERKMRKPVSLVEDDTFAGLKFPSRRPIGHHRVVTIDNWHASAPPAAGKTEGIKLFTKTL